MSSEFLQQTHLEIPEMVSRTIPCHVVPPPEKALRNSLLSGRCLWAARKQLAVLCFMSALLTPVSWAQAPKSTEATPAVSPPPAAAEKAPSPAATTPATHPILREGTEWIDQRGQFRVTGDRVTFFPADGSGRLIVLENLNLQRITRVLSENAIPLDWKVSGLVTECRGSNYLFIRSAVLKTGTEVREDVAP
jgi:hypothetical protein